MFTSLPLSFGPLVVVLAVAGGIWGYVADRIGARWPAHEDGSIRKRDWRTLVVVAFGIVAMAAVPARFDDTGERLLFGVFFAALVLMMATDLDQRLLPDEITLPIIVLGVGVLIWGGDTLVNRQPGWLAVAGAVFIPTVLLVLSLPFGAGAFGIGDVKLLTGAGLLLGIVRLALAVFAGIFIAAIVIILLLVARRVTLKSYVPFAPFLILGVFWITLLPVSAG